MKGEDDRKQKTIMKAIGVKAAWLMKRRVAAAWRLSA
jgi:hypothetical protein